MTDFEFRKLCIEAFNEFVKLVPNPKTRYKKDGSTGNMALNATKIEFPEPGVCLICVDPKIAPYVPYTNEPWGRRGGTVRRIQMRGGSIEPPNI